MEKIGTYTDSLNIEIFELEDKCKKIQQENAKLQEENKKTKMFVAMYYKKAKELDKIKRMLLSLYENSNDHVRYQIDEIFGEMEGIKRS